MKQHIKDKLRTMVDRAERSCAIYYQTMHEKYIDNKDVPKNELYDRLSEYANHCHAVVREIDLFLKTEGLREGQ